jgi:hypothetical protein
MASTAVGKYKVALGLVAYGIELRLWKEPGEREWGASFRHDNNVVSLNFEEDNLTLAKLHVLGEAWNRLANRAEGATLPSCDTLLDSWKPVKMTQP